MEFSNSLEVQMDLRSVSGKHYLFYKGKIKYSLLLSK